MSNKEHAFRVEFTIVGDESIVNDDFDADEFARSLKNDLRDSSITVRRGRIQRKISVLSCVALKCDAQLQKRKFAARIRLLVEVSKHVEIDIVRTRLLALANELDGVTTE